MDARELTADRLREVLHYCPETGIFKWLSRPNRRIRIGSVAGSFDKHGYVTIKIDGSRYFSHRLAWLWMTGGWPKMSIDHRDTSPANNRWLNLREITHQGNTQNRRRPNIGSATGLLGSTPTPHGFVAQIQAARRRYYLGTYSTPEEAHAAYVAAKRQLHEGCTL